VRRESPDNFMERRKKKVTTRELETGVAPRGGEVSAKRVVRDWSKKINPSRRDKTAKGIKCSTPGWRTLEQNCLKWYSHKGETQTTILG